MTRHTFLGGGALSLKTQAIFSGNWQSQLVSASRGPEETLVMKTLKEAETYQLCCYCPTQQPQESPPNLSQEYLALVSTSQAVHNKADLYSSSWSPQAEISEVFDIPVPQGLPIAP